MTKSGIVIDDDKDLVEIVSKFLELKGFSIKGKAHNGCAAAQLYQSTKPDFVVLDMKMPDYDGNHAINEIKKINPDAKIFVVTGYSEYKGLEQKVEKVFSKPCNLKHLVNSIECI